MREQQAQEANEAQVAELKEAVKAGQEEAADLHARLATVVPRDQLTAAQQRIKVTVCTYGRHCCFKGSGNVLRPKVQHAAVDPELCCAGWSAMLMLAAFS